VDVLLTWNCRHLADPNKLKRSGKYRFRNKVAETNGTAKD